MRYKLRKNVSVQHHNHANDGRQRHRMPKHKAENRALITDLIGRGGSDADRLRVDHFPHHATGAVRGAH